VNIQVVNNYTITINTAQKPRLAETKIVEPLPYAEHPCPITPLLSKKSEHTRAVVIPFEGVLASTNGNELIMRAHLNELEQISKKAKLCLLVTQKSTTDFPFCHFVLLAKK
jgi:hypothetical protein